MNQYRLYLAALSVCAWVGTAAAQHHAAVLLPQDAASHWTSALSQGLGDMLYQNGYDSSTHYFSSNDPATLWDAIYEAEARGADFVLAPEFGRALAQTLADFDFDADILTGNPARDGAGLVLGYGWLFNSSRAGTSILAIPGNRTIALQPAIVNIVDFRWNLRGSYELEKLQNWLKDTHSGQGLTEAFTLVPVSLNDPIEIRPMPLASDDGCGCDNRFGITSACDPDGWHLDPGALGFDAAGAMILNRSGDDDRCGCEERLMSLSRFLSTPTAQDIDRAAQWDFQQVIEMARASGRLALVLTCDPD